MIIEFALFGLIILALNVFGIINVIRSGATTATKRLWVLVIALLPFIGLILWLETGPRRARAIS